MKKIFIILVLLFPSSLIAETFKCQLEYYDMHDNKTSFELFIDTGDTDAEFIVLLDKDGKYRQKVTAITSVGKVYSDDYPLAGQKVSNDAYFNMVNSISVQGFFIHLLRTVPIDISLYNADNITISIYDPGLPFFTKNVIEGVCK